ncbi:patatin-like protein [Qipengyuania sp. DY56-A-20]|uniref:Patatin-like protein n=1 Tax=Qipengyuania benthica TaxID=3067651 RepID=A0ABT9H7D9_9SPHN|nr:patatin-like protein [Qipengyuania sp. DY56-A-20]MBU1255043.1 patatin-like protein [Alphaproteobacteria bacterium]MBU1607681.1 patatin-like protein [Alphaproteobacteria bacterium]MDP4539236.1 patatin-like protein [Qipengyuania sp. DY56-A-20]
MRQKELRIALVCYGGVSLAVYMHGVTKEVWHLARASRAYHDGDEKPGGVAGVYRDLIDHIERERQLRLRVLPDILTGASAGGINAVFLAQAVHSGYSLDPLTDLWLDMADVDELVDPDARPMWRFAKFWSEPLVRWVLTRPGNLVSESVAPETRDEVRRKVSRFIRGRWFEPPFSGAGFSALLERAFAAMERTAPEAPLLPPRHPLDLFVTATDFHGHLSLLRLNSPPVVEESEHRMPIDFRSRTPAAGGRDFADPVELVFAARATASFPGAFPPLQVAEIDALAERTGRNWPGRRHFFERIMPVHLRENTLDEVALIDGSVLVNKPFEGAIAALRGRPAQREVDRRFVYVDPRPDRSSALRELEKKPVGFFSAIFGSLSTIPREQPIRDNLEALEEQSREALRLRRIVARLRPDVEGAVEQLFGRTLFLDKPTARRLSNWRQRAQTAAAEQAGYAFQSYAQAKVSGIVARLAKLTLQAAPQLGLPDAQAIEAVFREELARRGLESLSAPGGGAHEGAIAFFRSHDLGFRIRRLRLLARRLARDWEADPDIPDAALETARDSLYAILALYFDREGLTALGPDFEKLAENVLLDPGAVLDHLENRRLLPQVDDQAELLLAEALTLMPKDLKRRMLLTYLGFPYYDVATLALLRDEGLTEFDPAKVDRISPEDARSIREGGTRATLRGTEFYNFGAFFSRAYRENDYLWGRLHGAERMVDLLGSTLEDSLAEEDNRSFKRAAFLAILDEEEAADRCSSGLIRSLRAEVEERLPE